MTLDTAIVDFVFKGKSFSSQVAVAHKDSLCGSVLFSVPMETATAEHLLLDAASKSDVSGLGAGQLRGTRNIQPSTRVDACSDGIVEEAPETSSAPAITQEETVNVRVVTRSKSKKLAEKEMHDDVVHVSESNPQPFDSDAEFNRLAAIDLSYDPPIVGDGHVVSVSSGLELLQGSDEDGDRAGVGDCAVSDGHDGPSLSHSSDSNDSTVVVPADLDLTCPQTCELGGVDVLTQAVNCDESLIAQRNLADNNLNGYSYSDSVLTHTVLVNDSPVDRIVVPKCLRLNILTLAHDKSSHIGVRGMRNMIDKRFTWPGIHKDIANFVKSCDTCLRVNSSGNRKATMVERKIVSVPFETVAVDLVGPLPKAKRGVRYLFTYVCLASRWPEAIPMRTASATEAAQCFVDIISRTGIPLKVLSDRGTIFLGKLMSGLYEMLGIDAIATSPYRSQSNGVVERLHGTLKPMLSKAIDAGIDWSVFLPLALFAIRQVPNRDVGFSPHCLVYGKDVVGPLDVLYKGWVPKY